MGFVVLCILFMFVIGGVCATCGIEDGDGIICIFGAIIILVGTLGVFGLKNVLDNNSYDAQYISAEPFACNQTQTVFTTDKGTYTADGLYPDGTYMLTVDGNDVLVVWQAVEGEVG